jgi:uncharacterized protein (DUF58 family)
MAVTKRTGTYKYLPPQMAEHLQHMPITVRKQMDGGMQGLHRSPSFGSSVEFAEYRPYVQGDPIRRIDWTVYARTDRYVIRRFHDEVNIRANILLDTSESMAYEGGGSMSKMEYGCYLAASIMYIMINQGDSAGLMTFDDKLREMYEPAGTFVGLRPMLLGLEEITPQRESNIENSLHEAAEMIKGRSFVVLISDLLQDPRETLRGVGHLCFDGKDVTVFHLLDPAELRLPDEGLIEVEFLETRDKMNVDISEFRELYLQRIREYLDEVRIGCTNAGADYILVDTSTDIRDTLHRRVAAR